VDFNELFTMSQSDNESVSFEPFDEGEIANDPFHNTEQDGDAAFLLGGSAPASSMSSSLGKSSEGRGSVSLLERIQQQKKQQTSPAYAQQYTSSGDFAPTANPSDDQLGYPTEDTAYFASTSSPLQTNDSYMNIPDYATSTNRPDPYYSSSNSNAKDQFFSVLSSVGSAAGSAANSAYRGSKTLYGNLVNNRQSAGSSAQDRMAEMDYQRESLLLDPHDVEDGTLPLPMGSTPTGLRGGIGAHSSVSTGGHPIVRYTKQFCVDLKDIFMGLSPNKKLFVIGFTAFLLWLFISEEWPHHGSN
jgi:hypothetical protein